MKEKAQVILYTRPGCHLCEEMKREIVRGNCAEHYSLQEINIETSADLLEKYQLDIPVVEINGTEAFRHRLSAKAFKDYVTRLPN